MTLQERILDRVEFYPPDACWWWTGAVNRSPNGAPTPVMKVDGKVPASRRVSFEAFIGPILEDDLRVASTCGNALCVSPWHLELRTGALSLCPARDYQSRVIRARPHFNCGHPKTPENMRPRSDCYGECRQCDLERKRLCRQKRSTGRPRGRPRTRTDL